MIGRRALSLLGSALLHLGAVFALLALAASLREPPPLFVDLTVGAPAGEEGAAAGTPHGERERPSAPAPRRITAKTTRSPERAPQPSRAEAPTPPASSLSMSREVAPVEPAAAAAVAAAPPPASASGGDSSVAGDRAAHAAPNSGAGGAGGVLLAAATPGTARGDVPPDFGPYLARFRQRIQEAVVYPLAARRRGLAGRVEVELLLEPSGRVREVSVVASSTHAILDEAAVEAVRSLEPQPLPEQTKRQTLRVRLPVVFQIQ